MPLPVFDAVLGAVAQANEIVCADIKPKQVWKFLGVDRMATDTSSPQQLYTISFEPERFAAVACFLRGLGDAGDDEVVDDKVSYLGVLSWLDSMANVSARGL